MNIRKLTAVAICLVCVPAIQGCTGLAAAATGAAAGTVVADDRRTPGTYVDDELIELKLRAAIEQDEALSSQSHINATSYNGLVLLTGEAPGESLRNRAVELARHIPKVRGVQNEIVLEAPTSLLARTTDTVTTGKVKAALLGNNRTNAGQIKVVTERGIVYLMGLLSEDEANRAANVTRRVPGVQRVVKVIEYIQ